MPCRAVAAAALTLTLAACATAPEAPAAPPATATAAAAPAAPAAAPAPTPLASDTPRSLPDGTTFVAPAGWTLREGAGGVVLRPAEQDMTVALVQVAEAADAQAAVAAAWAAHAPGMQRPVETATALPGRNGWKQSLLVFYVTEPAEKRLVGASAYRAGGVWTVVLLDAGAGTYDRRRGPYRQLLGTLKPAGFQPESFAGRTAHRLDAARIAQLQAFLELARRELDIPGIAFSLVQDGQVVHAGGLGVRELGKPGKVDADTLFMAASNTKAMTTLLLAQLVDEGKLRWEQPVVEVFPDFQLAEADVTKRVQVRHLVCACTGIPRMDSEWAFEGGRLTPRDIVQSLARLKATSGFGEVFQYSNLLPAAAGYMAAHVLSPGQELGAAYDDAMMRRLFGPLQMRRTTLDFGRAMRDPNRARPHGVDMDGRMQLASMDFNFCVRPIRPGSAAWTTARDLARWVQLELARGALPSGKRLVSAENLRARYAPQVRLSATNTYGMGLTVEQHRGVDLVFHGGTLVGQLSDMMWLPEHGVGAVLLTNASTGSALLKPFQRRLMEVLFDGQPEAEDDLRAMAAYLREQVKAARPGLTLPAEPAVAATLAPRYAHPRLGTLEVRREGGRTVFDFGEWRSTVASSKAADGTLTFVLVDPGLWGDSFVVTPREGGPPALTLAENQHEYVFEPVPAPSARR